MIKLRLNKESNNGELKYSVIFLFIYESYEGFNKTTKKQKHHQYKGFLRYGQSIEFKI